MTLQLKNGTDYNQRATMLVMMQLIKILGASKLEAIISECLSDGDDSVAIAETLEAVAGVELTRAQLERLVAVLSNGNYKSALAVYRAA